MLKHRRPYEDPGADYYQQQYQERTLRHLKRKAAQLGLQLVPRESPDLANISSALVPEVS